MTIRIVEANFVLTSVNAGHAWMIDTIANRATFLAAPSGIWAGQIMDDATHGYGAMLGDDPTALDVFATREQAMRIYPGAEG